LQGHSIDIVKAYLEIDESITDLKAVRDTINTEFKLIYSQAERLAAKLKVEPQIPRLAKLQMHRDNQPAKTPEEYYRGSLAIPL
jgi:hypothetical protein